MNVKIQTSKLREGLNKILTVIDRKNSRPILTNNLVILNDTNLELIATDLEVTAKVILPAQVNGSGKFCINTKNLFDILRELPDEELTLEVESEGGLLKLNCQKINYSLLISNPDEYPQVSFGDTSNSISLSSKNLLNIIAKTSHAISNDETRINLNGIYLQNIESKLRAVAIDGHRLALLDILDFNYDNHALKDGIIIPKKGIGELKKLAESNLDGEIKINIDESFIYANSNDEYFLSVRLIAREYPKYQTVIPSKTTHTLLIEKNIFYNAVKRIKLLSNEKTNGIKCSFSSSELLITADHPSLGQAKESIQVEYDGPEMEIGFNARYMIDALSILDVNEIIFEFNNELSPVIIRSNEEENFLGIIMPLKI
ncbi:MAG: DNA polymerase III subunit beta [Halobacteriovoraceae bacterium]|nr:DNA polymerase III subunit beta [Halobacteriovoraceae bacterium]|tara:strand:- start:15571 stop:16686 length:1116 start_codon:yes stop_codon:yes gene_type:complete